MRNHDLTNEEREQLKKDINETYSTVVKSFCDNMKKKKITASFVEERKEVKNE